MIEICREDLNQKKIEEMAGKYPIAKVFANQGSGTCFIHEVRKEEIVVEDLFGQVHPLRITDLVFMQFFLDFEEIFKMMKDERAVSSGTSKLEKSFEEIEKKLASVEV